MTEVGNMIGTDDVATMVDVLTTTGTERTMPVATLFFTMTTS
jgi:hypothetical protein